MRALCEYCVSDCVLHLCECCQSDMYHNTGDVVVLLEELHLCEFEASGCVVGTGAQ